MNDPQNNILLVAHSTVGYFKDIVGDFAWILVL